MNNVKIINEKQTKTLFKKVLPNSMRYAIANTCTRVVYKGLQNSEAQIKSDFILRGAYVVGKRPGTGAVKYEKAIPHHNIDDISAKWGSVDKVGSKDYSFMEKQEEGFTNENKPVPDPKTIRIGKSEKKKVSKRYYLKGASIKKIRDFSSYGGSDKARRVIAMRNAYAQGFALPNSNQFFSFEDNDYAPGWEGGLFQFSGTEPPQSSLSYPNLRRMYYNPEGKNKSKRRRARKWMEQSKNKISQSEIDKFYSEEMSAQLSKQMQSIV